MKTTNLFDLKKAVEHDPQLLEYVEKLGESQYRLSSSSPITDQQTPS